MVRAMSLYFPLDFTCETCKAPVGELCRDEEGGVLALCHSKRQGKKGDRSWRMRRKCKDCGSKIIARELVKGRCEPCRKSLG